MNAMDHFKAAIAAAGMVPPDHIEPGKIVRFSDNDKRNKDGYAVFFLNSDGSAGGAFGNWSTIKESWFYVPNGRKPSFEMRRKNEQEIKAATEQMKAEQEKKWAAAAEKARADWEKAQPADPEHKYLSDKKIDRYGVRQVEDALMVPVFNEQGNIQSYQLIYSNGKKYFLEDGKIQGGYFIIPGDPRAGVGVGEGLATMATIKKEHTGSFFVAFNSGNLKAVAEIARRKFPTEKITIYADNDLETEKKTGINPGRRAGEAAAAAIGADLCLCPCNSDFNDLFVSQGANALKKALQKTRPVDPKWEPVVSLKDTTVEPMNPAIFKGPIGDLIRAVAEDTQTPIELVANMVLAVIATACQGKVSIEIKPGYHEPVNVYLVTVLDPGNRKTAVLIKTTSPLTAWEKLQAEKLEPEIREAASIRKNQDARLKYLRSVFAKENDLSVRKEMEDEILDLEQNLVDVPVIPQLWCQDVTMEHLGTLMSQQGGKMAILSAEGGVFDVIGGRYSQNVPNVDLINQGHACEPVRVSRGSREPVFLDTPNITMGLAVQMDVLMGMGKRSAFVGRGVNDRMLYTIPESLLGKRSLDAQPVPESVKNAYHGLVFDLLDIEPEEDESGKLRPYALTLSSVAYREWSDFYNAVEKELGPDGKFETAKGWAGKLPGAAARLAALLHCSEYPVKPWSRPVSGDTMSRALELAATYSEHALLAFNIMGADADLSGAEKILSWIEKNRLESFTKRDCFNALKSTFKRVAAIDDPLSVLEERNYIMSEVLQTGGRPSVKYTVNPEVIKEW